MSQTTMPISKRTKQEILDEYEKLQEQLDDLRSSSKAVHSQPAVEMVARTKEKSSQSIDKALADFQTAFHLHLSDVRTSLLEQTTTFQELQHAIDLSRQQLDVQHHISIAADTLENLVDEHTKRAAAFELESAQKKKDFEEQMAAKKKAWEREAEECEYQKKVKRERDLIETEEREKTMAVREAAIRAQEQEIIGMKKAIEQAPKELETALAKQQQDVHHELTRQFAHEKTLLEKETGAQIRLLELTVKNLEERLASQSQEIASLKQQANEANAKAQALAIKAIERPTTVVTPAVQSPSSQYQERQG